MRVSRIQDPVLRKQSRSLYGYCNTHTFLFQNTNYQKASFFGRFFFYQFGSKKNYQKTEILRVYQCFFMKKINEKRPLKPQKFLGAFGAECAHLIFLSKIAQIFLVVFFWYIFFGSKKSTKNRKFANYQIGRFFLPKKICCDLTAHTKTLVIPLVGRCTSPDRPEPFSNALSLAISSRVPRFPRRIDPGNGRSSGSR